MIITLSPFPTLVTDRLVLRPLNMSDKEDLMHIRSDEQVNKYLYRKPASSLDEVAEFIGKIHQNMKNQLSVYWVISLKEHKKLIGTICYWNMIPEKEQTEIGYELLPCYQGLGLMQEALNKVINYGFNTMHLKTIIASVCPQNTSSVKLLNRNNFALDAAHQYVSEEEAGREQVYVLTK